MNQNHEELVNCDHKITYDTKADASAAASVATYRYGTKLKVYRCRACGLWHLATDYEK